MKYNHYVALLKTDNRLMYVTNVDNENRCAFWKDGEPALKMSKLAADDLVCCLVANGHKAVVMRVPDLIKPVNPK